MQLLSSILLAVAMLAAPAGAQYLNVLTGGTNNVAANSTNAYSEVIRIDKGQLLACQPAFAMTAAGATSNVVFVLDQSCDGVIWHTAAHTIALPATGAATNTVLTNINFGAAWYARLSAIRNTNSIPVTNVALAVSVKPGI